MTALFVDSVPIDQQNGHKIDRDAHLQASRRIDWRFLLPQPTLSHTAYIGRSDSQLLDSLGRFCSSVEVLTASSSTNLATFPLVVAHDPTLTEFRYGIKAVNPGGWLYVELSRKRMWTDPQECCDELRKQGFDELQLHWHWPDFASCCELIPCDDDAAISCALQRRGSGLRSWSKTAIARLLLRCKLLVRFLPSVSILGRKS